MPIHDHAPKFIGRAFFWGGIGLGALLVVVLLTHGFHLLGGRAAGARSPAMLVHQGEAILVPEGSALRRQLKVEAAAERSTSPQLQLPATVESDPARTAAVLPPVAGRLIALKVALGDRVGRGQVLALIDSPDLRQAYADNDNALNAFNLTRRNLERQEAQHQLGVVSDRELDQSQNEHRQAATEFARTQERLRIWGAPAEASGRGRVLSVVSPVAGSVTAVNAAAGNMINDATQPLMTVADLSTVWVTALAAEKDMPAVAKNELAQVRLLAYPERLLTGRVQVVSDVLEPDTRRNKIRISLANADYTLKPNMFATVTLTGASRRQVMLPSSALLMNNDRTTVFVATAPWTFERRSVVTQLEEGSTVAIVSGVKAGDQVLIQGGILLND